MPITMRPDLEATLRSRAAAEGLSVEEYVDRLVRAEQQAEEELERLVLEGIDSGPAFEVDDQYWQDKRQRLIDRHKSR